MIGEGLKNNSMLTALDLSSKPKEGATMLTVKTTTLEQKERL